MKNLGHISHEYDVVTKKYVDNKVSEAEIGYIEKSYSGSDITFSDEELKILKKPGSYIGLVINNEIKYFNRNTQSTATETQAIQFVSEPDAPSEDIRTQLAIIINYSTKTGTVITSVEELAIQSDWSQTNTNSLDYIKNKPSIPTKVSDLSDSSSYATKEYVNNTLTNLSITLVDKQPIEAIAI